MLALLGYLMTDTLTSAIVSIGSMSEKEYIYIVVKMLGIIGVALTGLFAFFVSGYKAFLVVWGMAVRHMALSLSPNYVTRQDFDKRISDILSGIESLSRASMATTSRFDEGSARISNIESSLNRHLENHA